MACWRASSRLCRKRCRGRRHRRLARPSGSPDSACRKDGNPAPRAALRDRTVAAGKSRHGFRERAAAVAKPRQRRLPRPFRAPGAKADQRAGLGQNRRSRRTAHAALAPMRGLDGSRDLAALDRGASRRARSRLRRGDGCDRSGEDDVALTASSTRSRAASSPTLHIHG